MRELQWGFRLRLSSIEGMNREKMTKSAKKLKLMTIIGTRPEIIRLSEVIKKCDRYFEQKLVHTGQNWDYTLNQIFLRT